jgi:threonine/homoserine/homoserine lactone efflux protein
VEIVRALGFALLFGFVGSVPLTGPIAVLVLSQSIQRKYREAIWIGIGAALAEGIYAGAAFFSFHTLIHGELVKAIANAVSAVVLAVLGIYFMRWKFKEQSAREMGGEKAIAMGFSISILNPTLFVTWLVAVAALSRHVAQLPSRLLTIPFGLGAAAGVAAWEVLFVLGVRRFGEKFSKRFLLLLVRAIGVLLIGVGAWQAYQSYRAIPAAKASIQGRRLRASHEEISSCAIETLGGISGIASGRNHFASRISFGSSFSSPPA